MYQYFFWSLVIITVLVVFLALLNIIHKKHTYTSIFIVSFLAFILVIFNRFTLPEIGLTIPNIYEIIVYSVMTILCCFGIFLLNKYWFKVKMHHKSREVVIWEFIFFTIVSVSVQEFFFRSFLYYSLNKMGQLDIVTMTVISCLLFGISHLAFRGKIFRAGVFLMGIVWGALYFYIPNLLLISLSHIIVGMFAYFQGLVTQDTFFIERNGRTSGKTKRN